MNIIIAILQGAWDWVAQFFRNTFSYGFWIIITAVSIVTFVVKFVFHQLSYFVATLSGETGTINAVQQGSATLIEKANGFFPIEDVFFYMHFMFWTWSIGIMYRLLKSYIPTLS